MISYILSRQNMKRFITCLVDMAIISSAFLLVAILKPATLSIVIPTYFKSFLVLLLIWVGISLLTEKYKTFWTSSYSKIFSAILRSGVFASFIIFGIIISFDFDHYSRLMLFGTIGFAILLEIVLSLFYYYATIFLQKNQIISPSVFVTKIPKDIQSAVSPCSIELNKEKYIPEFKRRNLLNEGESIYCHLAEQYLEEYPKLLEFITKNINLEHIASDKTKILETSSFFNLKNEKVDSLEFFINLHRINDYQSINKYFRKINDSMKTGGVFLCTGNTIKQRNNRLKQKYPKVIANILHVFDFVIHRVFPKLRLTKGIYFKLTKGRNKVLSMTEMLGRLNYCGFKVIDVEEINGLIHFLVKKDQPPLSQEDPVYGPLLKIKRSGKGGKWINVYKFRTMHPYSEYIHSFMLDVYGFGDKGKVDLDFRITRWGKFLRKTWLDELPQLINFFKGELGIVGVRPLSARFLSEYPDELKEERFKHRCGCIPPYVALKMQAVDEYIESERIYFRDKKAKPYTTDMRYFFTAVYNILAKKIVSE